MKKIINKKSLKGALAVMLCAVMAFSVCACNFDSDTELTKTDAQIQFDKYCDDLFSEELEDDVFFTAHFDISNPSDYGLKYDEEDYTLGHVSDEDTKESFDELKRQKRIWEEFDRSGLTSSQKQTYDTLESYFEIQLSYEGREGSDLLPAVGLPAPPPRRPALLVRHRRRRLRLGLRALGNGVVLVGRNTLCAAGTGPASLEAEDGHRRCRQW